MDPFSSATEMAAAVRHREESPLELLEACLERVDRLNPEINAVVWRNDEEARAEAARLSDDIAGGDADLPPFAGVPVPIKDLNEVAGWPVAYGSFAGPDGPSAHDELVVAALRRAGFVLTGRTNVPEIRAAAGRREPAVRRHPEPLGHRPHPRRFERRGGGRRGRRPVPAGARQRRWRLAADPRLVQRPGRPEGQPGPGAGRRAGVDGGLGGRRAHPHRGRRRRRPRRDQRARPARLVQRTDPRPSVRRRGGRRPRPAAGGPVGARPPRAPGGPGGGRGRPPHRDAARVARPQGDRDRGRALPRRGPRAVPLGHALGSRRLPRHRRRPPRAPQPRLVRGGERPGQHRVRRRPRGAPEGDPARGGALGRGFRRPGHPHHGHPAPRGRHRPRAGPTRSRPASRSTRCRWPPSPRRST